MRSNFLEELVAEWYEFNGYFVRRNVYVGKLKKGGYECELDIVAFHPERRELVHIEPTMDADSWATREKRYEKKFLAGRKYIPGLFKGLNLPSNIEQIALLGFGSDANHKQLGGGEVLTIEKFLMKIFTEFSDEKALSRTVPENFQILRAYQFVCTYPSVMKGLSGAIVTTPN